MAEQAQKFAIHQGKKDKKFDPAKIFSERESKELVIGFAGPVGCGLSEVIDATKQMAQEFGYTIVPIKVSEFIKKLCEEEIKPVDNADRYIKLQDAGSKLRKKYGYEILAKCIATKIATTRKISLSEDEGGQAVKDDIPQKVVYLIDQLKHPDEVNFLRIVYRNLFYLVGVLSCEERRKKRLLDEQMDEGDAVNIMNIDKDEGVKHGQQLEDTLQLSDLFLRNSYQNRLSLEKQVKRFLELLHGKVGITPTKHESSMYIAHSAAQRSACLSRQVGASITDADGHIIATGCNDVPKYGGGLYTESNDENDHRCIFKGNKCYNDYHKDLLKGEIGNILKDVTKDILKDEVKKSLEDVPVEEKVIDESHAIELADKIKKATKLKDLIEYSRSVHAEMDAITSAARKGGKSTQDSYLYSTTFPCHNCARHILAAGIKRVYYIEPYEKSLAYTLHDDAIAIDPDNEDAENSRVSFLHFEGISPRRFLTFFHTGLPRKENGKALPFYKNAASKVSPQYIDSYIDFEKRVIKEVDDMGLTDQLTQD